MHTYTRLAHVCAFLIVPRKATEGRPRLQPAQTEMSVSRSVGLDPMKL